MILHSMTVDGFLDYWSGLRQYADEAEYSDVVNPADGVTYPGICTEVPVAEEVRQKLSGLLGAKVTLRTIFMRLSLAGVKAPHQAHTDAAMGRFSLMLYLNRAEHCEGGTALVRHESGMDSNATTPEEQALWERDTNDPSKWSIMSLCEMRPNRAFIFNADLMHCAMPLGGFGDSAHDGRLVLTAFVG